MPFTLPKTDYPPHPEGSHTGTIVEVRDRGMTETQYGPKHRILIIIENDNLRMDDGRPWQLAVAANLSGGKNARLTGLREKLLRRPLSPDERASFDQDAEMLHRRVQFQVEHNYTEDGTFANLVTWSSLEDPAGPPMSVSAAPPPPPPAPPPASGEHVQSKMQL